MGESYVEKAGNKKNKNGGQLLYTISIQNEEKSNDNEIWYRDVQ